MTDEIDELPPLSKKHQRVLDEYLICFIQWRAYKAVYPKSSDEVARTLASRLFANANFQAHLTARLNEVHMSADEALKLTADIARGDVTEFITGFGNIDIDIIRKSGRGRLIKKIKQKTVTKIGKGEDDEDTEILDTEIELYNAQEALRDILKIHGKFTDKVDITSNGNTLEPKEDNARFDRALESLADALREAIPHAGNGAQGKVDTPE